MGKSFHLHIDLLCGLVVEGHDEIQTTEHHTCRQSQLRGYVPLLENTVSVVVLAEGLHNQGCQQIVGGIIYILHS